tara:strand:+ start:1677 stop:2150 length:474 start_codon:yes stop_codon:yes gene_type:complete
MVTEIALAVKAAHSSVQFITKAVNAGHDVMDLTDRISTFFDAKEKIQEAEIASKNPSLAAKLLAGGSIESQALQVTTAKYKIAEQEKQLREIIMIYGAGEQFYADMLRERRDIRQRRLTAARKKAERKKMILDCTLIALVTLIGATTIPIATVWLLE